MLLLAFAMISFTASAQLSWGVMGGLNVSNFSTSADGVIENQAGFFIGPTMKFTVPLIGIGFDASLMYDQRSAEVDNETLKQQQVVLPVNLRYQIGLGDLASVIVFAGPQFGVNVGSDLSEQFSDGYNWKSTNLSVNMGLGVMLLSHLQVTANYNLACGKCSEASISSAVDSALNGNFNSWQIGLAYYF